MGAFTFGRTALPDGPTRPAAAFALALALAVLKTALAAPVLTAGLITAASPATTTGTPSTAGTALATAADTTFTVTVASAFTLAALVGTFFSHGFRGGNGGRGEGLALEGQGILLVMVSNKQLPE